MDVSREPGSGPGRRPQRSSAVGRPRSETVDRAIASAALRVLAERGPARVSVESVAECSGVAKTTIYRRFRNRRELLRHALSTVVAIPEPSADLPAIERIAILLDQFRHGVEEVVGLRVVATLLLDGEDPEFAETFRAHVLRPRLDLLRRVFDEGVATGEFRPGVDYRRVGDLLVGAYFVQHAVDGDVGGDWPGSALDVLLPVILSSPPDPDPDPDLRPAGRGRES